ncbi:hypothetical protein [Devosia nitrariae]|uniref:DUF4386 family protein n=1 Tax=Devosia nitrariae TaxID=2071872 RepID=A0ABQ5WAZ3_9HYPH|nr:hypothetical protein [Devosia nitrariae]GLQ57290.1 hypothetical protein GCM10010862_45490 [Devosia nitrariae]
MHTGATREGAMKPTARQLLRWSGLAAVVAGVIFAGIQPIHPPDFLASVTTQAWAVIMPLKTLMCLLFLIGIAGLYFRQLGNVGWVGFLGFVCLTLSWWLQTGFVFAEALIVPVLATAAPQFIDSFLGIVNGVPGEMDIGALPAVYGVVGILYMLGGLLLGIATFRAGVLPRAPAALLAAASLLTPLAALLPHEIQRYAAIPVGLALAWLGLALWLERDAQSATPELHLQTSPPSMPG